MADESAAVKAKWRRVLATNKDPAVQARAKEVLAGLGVSIVPDETRKAKIGEQRAKVDRLNADPDPMSFGEIAKAIPRGIDDMAGAIGSTFNEGFAFGLPAKVLDMSGLDSPQTRAERKARGNIGGVPVGELVGNTVAMGTNMTRGPEALLGRGVEATLPAAKTVAGSIGRSAVSGGVQGAASATARSGLEGAGARETGLAALRGTVFGAGVGGAMGAGGAALGKAADAIMGSTGGQSRRLIEKHGGEVSPMTPGRGGAFDGPLAGLPANDKGIGMASRRSAGKVVKGIEEDFYDETAMPHKQAREAIGASVDGDVLRDVTPIYSQLVGLYKSERLTPPERGLIKGVLERMDKHVRDNGSPMMTETDLNDFRGMLGDLSGRGSPGEPSVAQSKLDKVTGATKEMVDQGPYADTNKRFAEGKTKFEGQRQMLDLPAKPATTLDPRREAPEGGREPEIVRVANMMSREGQNTVTEGVRNSDRLAQFADQNPKYADDLDMPDLMRAKADLSFSPGVKGHGGLVNRMAPGLGLAASMGMAMSGEHGARAMLPLAAGYAAQNWPAITGRLLYTPTLGAEQMARDMPTALPGFIPEIEQAYAEYLARRTRRNANE